jgi:putative Mg2+ transporter-C (MgtC) family protein
MDRAAIVAYLEQVNTVTVILRLLLATILGGAIGLDRERHGRAAGFRTHILVCLGAAMTVLTGIFAVDTLGFAGDPMRIAAQVVSGIGFIGAGTILITKPTSITGLTTAAGLWTTASVGLAIGAGFYLAAILCSIIVLITMSRLSSLECKYGLPVEKHIYIELDSTNAVNETIDGIASSGTTLHKPKVHPPYSGIEGHVGISAILPQALSDEQINEILQAILSLDHVEYTLRI